MTTNLSEPEFKEEYPNKGNLTPYLKHYGSTREEQIKINQKLLEILEKWRSEDAKLTDEEIQSASEAWEMAKIIIDENRDRKLFS